jgi:hypothetical protein
MELKIQPPSNILCIRSQESLHWESNLEDEHLIFGGDRGQNMWGLVETTKKCFFLPKLKKVVKFYKVLYKCKEK